jgi:hypothetical protein
MNLHLVFSVFTSRPTFLLVSKRAPVFFIMTLISLPFRTIISYQKSVSIIYDVLSLPNSTLLTFDHHLQLDVSLLNNKFTTDDSKSILSYALCNTFIFPLLNHEQPHHNFSTHAPANSGVF